MNTNEKLIEGAKFGGVFTFEHIRNGRVIDEWPEHNIVPEVGIHHILNRALGSGSPAAITQWYIGLFSNVYTPQDDDLYSHIGTRFTEISSQYSETTRPTYDPAEALAKLVTNEAGRAAFNFTADVDVNGAFLVSSGVKGDSAAAGAIMLASTSHSPTRIMLASDQLLVRYDFTGASS